MISFGPFLNVCFVLSHSVCLSSQRALCRCDPTADHGKNGNVDFCSVGGYVTCECDLSNSNLHDDHLHRALHFQFHTSFGDHDLILFKVRGV